MWHDIEEGDAVIDHIVCQKCQNYIIHDLNIPFLRRIYIHHVCVFVKWYDSTTLRSDFIPGNFPQDRPWIYVLHLRIHHREYQHTFRKFELTRAMRYMSVYTHTHTRTHNIQTRTYKFHTWTTRRAAPSVCAFPRKCKPFCINLST